MRALPSVEAVVAGQILAGRFRVEGELGEGGMARVYRVTDLATQRAFALKLLKASIADDREAVARLRREAEVLSTIDNPAVVRIETYGQLPDGRLFLVIELLEGETLGARIRREQRLSPEALAPIVAGVAAGLGAAHRTGVIHRDLKPDNVFLARAPDGGVQVKILDFGISKVYSNEERLTRTGQVLGTPRYMAPEQLSAEPDLDGRTDVYALGVILYEALAGTPPFVAATPSDLILAILHGKVTPLRVLRPELPAEIESIVARAMARHRDLRYASPVELAEAWLALAAPARSGPRAGMATKLVGSGGLGLASVEHERADATPAAPGFRIATFSELEQSPAPPAGETARLRPAANDAAPSAASPASAAATPDPYVAASHASGPHTAAPHAAQPYVAPEDAGAWADPNASAIVLPTTGARWLWIALALLAGALTAGLALALLGARDAEESGAGGASSSAAPSSGDAAPSAAAPSATTPSPSTPAATGSASASTSTAAPSTPTSSAPADELLPVAAPPPSELPASAQASAPARGSSSPAREVGRSPRRARASDATSAPPPPELPPRPSSPWRATR